MVLSSNEKRMSPVNEKINQMMLIVSILLLSFHVRIFYLFCFCNTKTCRFSGATEYS